MITLHGVHTIKPNDTRFDDARRLRHEILFRPFGLPDTMDFDDGDPESIHLVILEKGTVVAYGRLVRQGFEAQIRHVCVDAAHQGAGIGTELLKALISRARAIGARKVYLNARFTAMGVYRRLGFVEVGGLIPAEDVALPHKRMELEL